MHVCMSVHACTTQHMYAKAHTSTYMYTHQPLYIHTSCIHTHHLSSQQIRGLQGGHSGAEIHLGLANAVVLLGEVLQEILTAHPGVGVVSLEAGFKRNAIPRDGTAMIMVCVCGWGRVCVCVCV